MKREGTTIALKSRLFGSGGTTSGVLGGIGSIHNVCHSLCVTVLSVLAIFGITTSILPLMFLQTYQMYFWVAALVFTAATLYFYSQQRHRVARDRNLLFINAGLLIFGLPFSQLANFMDFFRFIGISLAIVGVSLFFFAKKFRYVQFPVSESVQAHVNNASDNVMKGTSAAIPTVSTIKLPKLTVSSALFALVVGGFLVNQYFMYRMGIFSNMSIPGTFVNNSAMQSQSRMKLTLFDTGLAKERMDKNNDGICDVCGMSIDQCISSGQIDCNMGNQKDAIGILESQHIHADFKVYVNGQVLDFSDKDHMGRQRNNQPVSSFIHVDSGSPAPEKTGEVLHMHATNVPLWLFFKSIGMKLDKDGLTLENGQVLKNGNGNTLKFYLNGKKVDELGDYVFQPLDRLLISYGPENDPDIERQLNSVTNFAKDH